jgi:hypothetical protein
LGKTTSAFYRLKKEEWDKKLAEPPTKRRGGRRVPAKQCIRRNGLPFTSLVLDSADRERITYRDVSDYLSLPLKHLPALENLVKEESARYA